MGRVVWACCAATNADHVLISVYSRNLDEISLFLSELLAAVNLQHWCRLFRPFPPVNRRTPQIHTNPASQGLNCQNKCAYYVRRRPASLMTSLSKEKAKVSED